MSKFGEFVQRVGLGLTEAAKLRLNDSCCSLSERRSPRESEPPDGDPHAR
jgi:hypothetical protein